jgi:5'-nucleotidase
MPSFLLTNDDGLESPLLPFLMEALHGLGHVVTLVPKHEQSWRGKSITRIERLNLEEITINDLPVYTLDGTPADCANLGIYHLFEAKPDLVISGINVGDNTGHGFLWSSGTVGACFEANIAGLPAMAISQTLDDAAFKALRSQKVLPAPAVDRLKAQTLSLLERIFRLFLNDADLISKPITWNVNLPFAASRRCELRATSVAQDIYECLFHKREGYFVHDLRGDDVKRDSCQAHDYETARSGHVSISEIDLWPVGRLDPARKAFLQGKFDLGQV